MTSKVAAVFAVVLGLPAWVHAQALPVRVVNGPNNPVPVTSVGVTPVTLTNSPSVTVAGPVQVQQASQWSVQVAGTPTVRLATDPGAVSTATVVASLNRTTQCQSLFNTQADPSHQSGRIWLVEAVNGRILAPSEDAIPPIELRAEAPDPNVSPAGFRLDHYYLGIDRAKVAIGTSGVNYVFNDRLNAYAVRSQQIYPQVCFSVPVDYDVFVELTFTGRLLTCADPLLCP